MSHSSSKPDLILPEFSALDQLSAKPHGRSPLRSSKKKGRRSSGGEDVVLRKKLFASEEEEHVEEEDLEQLSVIGGARAMHSPLSSTGFGFGGSLLAQFNSGESPISTGGMEWDVELATPSKNEDGSRRGIRRTLDASSGDESMFMSPPAKQLRPNPSEDSSSSPINSGLQQLCLFDTPHTPKSIVRRSSFQQSPTDLSAQCKPARSRLTHLLEEVENRRPHLSSSSGSGGGTALKRQRSRGTNINPFTPQELQSRSRTLLGKNDPNQASSCSTTKKGLTLRENNISRYNAEFHEVSRIGSGQFGTVYQCINRLDGCTYAVKKSRKPVAGSADEAAAMREVYAHAVIGSHEHIVRYYSAWAEDNHMIIQNEFCNGGNLADRMEGCVTKGTQLSEHGVMHLMEQVAMGLQFIHSKGLVHLDIKPDNIFVCCQGTSSCCNQSDSGISCSLEEMSHEHADWELPALSMPIYKIGDMGHVSSVGSVNVEEGDSRYLPKELLNSKFDDLPKADVFSLGLTVYAAATLKDLPKNGEEWHRIRDGHLTPVDHLSPDSNRLLQSMVHPDPKRRPSSGDVLSHQTKRNRTPEEKSRAELQKELQLEKMKNKSLEKELSLRQASSSDVHPRRLNRVLSNVF